MTMIGSISAKITADDTDFLAAMGRVKTSLSSQATQLRSSANNYAKWGAAAAAAAAVAGSALVKNTADGIRELKTFSQVANTSTQDFQKMAYGAKTMGIEQDKLADILKDVNDRVGDFGATGGGAMADFFTNIAPKVGVTYENFKKLSGKDALQLYVSSLEKANLSQADMTFYMEAMASDSTQLLPLLRDNGKAFAAMAKEADDLGLVLSDIDVAKAAAAAEQMGKLEFIMGSAAQQATVELAPVIIGLAKHLTEAAKEAGGFGTVFFNAIDSAVSVIGVFADGIHGINVIVEGLKTAFWGLASVVSSAMMSAAMGIDSFISGTKENINGLIEVANKLPGVSIELFNDTGSNISSFFQEKNAEVQKLFNDSAKAAHDLAMQEMPSVSMEKWVANARKASEEVAASIAAAMAGKKKGKDDKVSNGMSDEEKEKLQAKLEAIRQSNLSEVEALKEKFAMEAEVLAQARLNNIVSEEEFQQQMVAISQKYADKKTAIEQKAKDKQKALDDAENKAKIAAVKGVFGDLSTLMNTQSRKLFEIGKVAAIANAVVAAHQGIVNTMKDVPYPYNIAASAAQGAAAFSHIQQIKSQSFSKGSGGGTSSFSGGVPATNTADAGGGQPSSRQVNISLTGSSFGAGSIRDLIAEINEATGDGVSLSTG